MELTIEDIKRAVKEGICEFFEEATQAKKEECDPEMMDTEEPDDTAEPGEPKAKGTMVVIRSGGGLSDLAKARAGKQYGG